MSPCLNSDGASKSCVNWGSRGDGAECASPLGFCVLSVARRAVDCCPSMSAFDVEEWLGAEVTIKGKVETLPDRVQEALKKGFEDDLWTVRPMFQMRAPRSKRWTCWSVSFCSAVGWSHA